MPTSRPLRSSIVCLGLTAALWAATPPVDGSARTVVTRAQTLLQRGDAAAAVALLANELQHHPGQAALLDLKGVAEAQLGHTSEAEHDLLAAIDADPELDGAYLNLGRLYQQEGQQDARLRALSIYERLLQRHPSNPEANDQSAVLLLQAGKFADSARHLQRLPEADRNHSQVAAVQCSDQAGLHQRQASECVRRWTALADFSDQDAAAALPILFSTGAKEPERLLLQSMQSHGWTSPAQQLRLATLDEQQGQLPEARALLEKLAIASPAPFPQLMQLAEIADRQHDARGALGYLAHARDLEPADPAVHFFFGMECVRLHLMQEAYLSLQKAVELAPENPYYNYALGAVILQRRNPDASVRYFEKFHHLRPHDLHGAYALGAAYFAVQDFGHARALLQPLTSDAITAAGAWYLLGRIDLARDRDAQAEAELRHALHVNPRLADAAAHLGLVLLREHQFAAAAQALRQALAIDPDNYVGNFQLLLLYRKTRDPRAAQQAARLQALQKTRAEREQDLFRVIRIDPSAGEGSDVLASP